MGHSFRRVIAAAVAAVLLPGCITMYYNFPEETLKKGPPKVSVSAPAVSYHIKRFDILDCGGYERLRELFAQSAVLGKAVELDDVPPQGLHVEVETTWKPLSFPALIFGYISVSTLTILPAWSTKDGYRVRYHVYMDGKKQQTYQYEFRRTVGLWLPLILLAWVNFATYDETDAFTATAYQFASDAAPLLAQAGVSRPDAPQPAR